jgi:hypothetical protein
MIGSPLYLSPQMRHNFDITEGVKRGEKVSWDFFKADVFSLGLTLLCAVSILALKFSYIHLTLYRLTLLSLVEFLNF